MMTVVLAAFICSMASKSTRSPSESRLELRLVENHEVRVAEERPCKAKPLAKPAAGDWPSRPTTTVSYACGNRMIVSCNAGQLRCFDDLLQIGVVQPCNDVLDGLSEQIDILRQISDAPAFAQIPDG